jgi:acyl carrier protein
MTGEETLARLQEFFSRSVADARELTPDASLPELGVLNSLAMARLVAFIREDLGVQLPARALTSSHFRTLNEITTLVLTAQTPPTPSAPPTPFTPDFDGNLAFPGNYPVCEPG